MSGSKADGFVRAFTAVVCVIAMLGCFSGSLYFGYKAQATIGNDNYGEHALMLLLANILPFYLLALVMGWLDSEEGE